MAPSQTTKDEKDYRPGMSTRVQVPGLAGFTALAICRIMGRTRLHLFLLRFTSARACKRAKGSRCGRSRHEFHRSPPKCRLLFGRIQHSDLAIVLA